MEFLNYFTEFSAGNSFKIIFTDGSGLQGKVYGTQARVPSKWVSNVDVFKKEMQGCFLLCINPNTKKLEIIELNTYIFKNKKVVKKFGRTRFKKEETSKYLDRVLEKFRMIEEIAYDEYLEV